MKFLVGSVMVLILSIYGGFFSGGYITLLSLVLISIFGFNFIEAALVTKFLNLFSSTTACIFFYHHGLINFFIGITMAVSMFLGAILGAKLAIKRGNNWIKNLFVITAIFMAIKLLFL